MMQNKKIEIYGTFGPSCKSQEILEEMIRLGLTGMRLNLSHTTLEKSKDYIENYKLAAKKLGVTPQILIDMQGPELRIGDMDEMILAEADVVELDSKEMKAIEAVEVGRDVENMDAGEENPAKSRGNRGSKKQRIPIPQMVKKALKPQMEVLLDDGKIRIRIEEMKDESVFAKVITGGRLKPHKSIKIVDCDVPMPVLTPHDINNLKKAGEYGVTALMQPFVFSGKDLEKVRFVLKEEGIEGLQIFAKIENKKGMENLETILPKADMIVIARGDLGNDMPLWELPSVQKNIEKMCKYHRKPYMVVTQMLASMEQNPIPTRAEVSDIFHAVYHGADAVMVTGETAVGNYPVEVIRYLANTVREALKYQEER